MAESVSLQIEIPSDLSIFEMPEALHRRLHALLDRQDSEGKLTPDEMSEAEALVELAENLSLLKIRAHLVMKKNNV